MHDFYNHMTSKNIIVQKDGLNEIQLGVGGRRLEEGWWGFGGLKPNKLLTCII